MEILSACPICYSEKIGATLEIKDYSISKESFSLYQCQICRFLFTNPRPAKDEISKYYESPDYISHSNSKTGLVNRIYQVIRKYSIRKKIRLISRYAGADRTILDIGCGTGEFLMECKGQNWIVKGIEPNKQARDFCIENYKLDVLPEVGINSIVQKSFKIITMWHVLEHVHELKERVKSLHNIIKDQGYAIIALPNHQSYDAELYENYWAAYDIPRHLYHFSPSNIKDLFVHSGFEWVESIPMKFDSFYVSILSEKYKENRFPLLNGFFSGLKSNMNAGKDSEKYSSVIYVFKKKS